MRSPPCIASLDTWSVLKLLKLLIGRASSQTHNNRLPKVQDPSTKMSKESGLHACLLRPNDPNLFTTIMADILRLYLSPAVQFSAALTLTSFTYSPDETLAMTFLYINKYNRFHNSNSFPSDTALLDPYVSHPLPHPTLPNPQC